MTELERKMGYTFKNKSFLENALRHRSYANEMHLKNNERMEFLGDAVLELIVSENLFKNLSDDSEGEMSKIRAALVCEQGLYELSKKIDLSEYIMLGNGEEQSGGRERPSIISDAFEAVLAAVFLDSDFETTRKWLINLMGDELKNADKIMDSDYKTRIQEVVQKNTHSTITYELLGEFGPDHNKTFKSAIYVDEKKIAEGEGHTKKESEQNAAKVALSYYEKL